MKNTCIALFLLGIAVLCATPDAGEETPVTKEDRPMEETAVIETYFGDIVFKFYPDIAPRHVENFKSLADEGFYDGCRFHRVIPGFMIQGGDPNSKDDDRSNDGYGGSGENVPAEFTDKLSHERGVVSMARSQDPDSASSQFFIMVADQPRLDGQYSIFGKVMEGMDAVDKIAALSRDSNDNPRSTEKAEMKKVYIEKREPQAQ